MDRRQVLQVLGACTVLPAWAFPCVESADIEKGTTSVLVKKRGAAELPDTAWDIPKIGLVSVGAIGGTYLPGPGYITESLPYLDRTIAIAPFGNELPFMAAHDQALMSDGKTMINRHTAEPLVQSTRDSISEAISGLDMVLLVAALGDPTVSAVASIVTQMLRHQGILTLGFAVLPFVSETSQSRQIAQADLRALRKYVDGLIQFVNHGPDVKDTTLHPDATWPAPMAFVQLCRNIMNPVCRFGLVNIDFNDLRHLVLNHEGDSAFGFGSSCHQEGAEVAAQQAIDHALLGQDRLQRASAVLVAVAASPQVLKLRDSQDAIKSIRKHLSPDAWIIYGVAADAELGSAITVSILATGIQEV